MDASWAKLVTMDADAAALLKIAKQISDEVMESNKGADFNLIQSEIIGKLADLMDRVHVKTPSFKELVLYMSLGAVLALSFTTGRIALAKRIFNVLDSSSRKADNDSSRAAAHAAEKKTRRIFPRPINFRDYI